MDHRFTLSHFLTLFCIWELAGGPHGSGSLSFADGSTYTGTMYNGTVKGTGTYKDAHTGTYEGTFDKGMLNGDNCVVHRTSLLEKKKKKKIKGAAGKKTTASSSGSDCFTQKGYFLNDQMHRKCSMTHPKKPLPTIAVSAVDSKTAFTSQEEVAALAAAAAAVTASEPKTEYVGHFVDGVRHGLFRAKGGNASTEDRWIFEGMYREGHREGIGEELYETKDANVLVGFLSTNQDNNEDASAVGGKEHKTSYAYDDDEENENTDPKDDDGTSAHRRLPLRYAGRWEKTFIMSRGIHSQKLGPGRFSGQYTMAKHPGEEPIVYSIIDKKYMDELALVRDLHRNKVRHWRDHRRTLVKVAKRNQHNYRQALQERRISFFDDDLWELMTPEEQALERAQQNMKKGQNLHSEIRVAMRKK